MGYIRNECMVVSCWDAERVLKLHAAAVHIFRRHGVSHLVSGITQHMVNGGAAFFVSPDGSKEGWSDSDTAAAARREYIQYLRSDDTKDLFPDWALVVLGGDDGEFTVTDHPNLLDDRATTDAA